MTQQEKTIPMPEMIDFDLPILDMNDAPVTGEDGAMMRIGEACVNSLMAAIPDDKSDGVQKLKRYNLARKIKGSSDDEDYPTVHLSSKQKTLILGQAEQIWSVLIYSRIHEALEGSVDDEEE